MTENVEKYIITLDDDPMVHPLIERIVGLKTIPFSSADSLLKEADRHSPTAAFVDLHLGVSETCLELLPVLRQKWPGCTIIVVTGDQSGTAVSEALACGADDFIRKPLDPMELIARFQVRLGEKLQKELKTTLQFGDLEINQVHKSLKGKSGLRYLSQTTLNLLLSLIESSPTIVTRDALKTRVWGEINISDNALDRKICELRHILKDCSSEVVIKTAYGQGFSLQILAQSELNSEAA